MELVVKALVYIVVELLSALIRGFGVMVCLGALAGQTGWACAIGYWASVSIAIAASFATMEIGVVES